MRTAHVFFLVGVRRSLFSGFLDEEVTMPPTLTVPADITSAQGLTNVSGSSAREDVIAVARELGVFSPHWLHTGCVYDAIPASAYSILVMPSRPDRTRRHNAYHIWWPAVAPSDSLYAAYRDQRVSWPVFAETYLSELERQRGAVLELVASHLLSMPARYAGVTFLGFRHAPASDETRVHCPRRVVLSWLLGDTETLLDPHG